MLARLLPLLAAIWIAPVSLAQVRELPHTPNGLPDFTGNWQPNGRTPLERPAGFDSLVISSDLAQREEAAALNRAKTTLGLSNPDLAYVTEWRFSTVGGEPRSSRITRPSNGRLPYTEEGRRIAALSQKNSDGPEGRSTEERCLTGLGATPLGGSVGEMGFYQIVQTPNYFVLQVETGGVVRIVGIESAPRPAAMLSLMGDSVGRWDGDTLVVETTKVSSWDLFWPAVRRPPILRPEGRLIERFTLISADEILYEFSIEDPVIFSEPWSAEYIMIRTPQRLYEYACHEGNYGLLNILQAARRRSSRNKESEPNVRSRRFPAASHHCRERQIWSDPAVRTVAPRGQDLALSRHRL